VGNAKREICIIKKFETRNSKFETNLKYEYENVQNIEFKLIEVFHDYVSVILILKIEALFRISIFEFRI